MLAKIPRIDLKNMIERRRVDEQQQQQQQQQNSNFLAVADRCPLKKWSKVTML